MNQLVFWLWRRKAPCIQTFFTTKGLLEPTATLLSTEAAAITVAPLSLSQLFEVQNPYPLSTDFVTTHESQISVSRILTETSTFPSSSLREFGVHLMIISNAGICWKCEIGASLDD